LDLFLIARFNNCIKLSGLVFAKPLFAVFLYIKQFGVGFLKDIAFVSNCI